jgi:hypothetical protein
VDNFTFTYIPDGGRLGTKKEKDTGASSEILKHIKEQSVLNTVNGFAVCKVDFRYGEELWVCCLNGRS